MFIIIVGGGKVGTYLARGLIKQEHEVVVIEKDARKAAADDEFTRERPGDRR